MDNLQATLSRAEYVYILNLLSARAVIGTEQEKLFPSDPSERQALITTGKTELKANQWLYNANGQGGVETHTLNNQLVLIVSITAAPELSLLVKRTTMHGNQYITYFVGKDIVVELIRTEDERYMLTSMYLTHHDFKRLISLINHSDQWQEDSCENRITIPSNLFDQAIALAHKTGGITHIHALLKEHRCEDETALRWSTVLTEAKPNTFFEFSAHSVTRSVEWAGTVLLTHPDDNIYVEYEPSAGELSIGSLSKANLATQIKRSLPRSHNLRQTMMQQEVLV